MKTLCKSCAHVREVVSGKGSVFLLCQLALRDKRFPKYPPQPVVHCEAYQTTSSAQPGYSLVVLADRFAVSRLDPDAPVPAWATGDLVSITRTVEELSVVCAEANVPADISTVPGWRCLRVVGKLDFSLIGIVASLTDSLARANISVFVISTHDTDYLLVKETSLMAACAALESAGHRVRDV